MYRVLIVDDEKKIRERVASKMPWQEFGFEVIGSAENGEKAWRMIRQLQPQVVLTDIRMPGMSGLQLVERIHREYPHIRTAIMSAYDDFAYAQEAMRFDARGYMLKPLIRREFRQLFGKIARELGTSPLKTAGNEPAGGPPASGGDSAISGTGETATGARTQLERNLYIAEAKRYIDHFYEDKIRLEDVAGHLHLNPNYFSSLFNRETGYSFVDYLNELRIARATELLLRTDGKISDISVSVGFASFSYFNKVFKKITGVTPREYQEGKAAMPTNGPAAAWAEEDGV
ncbi:response regulator transcription factor [Paenibacillus cymbidii]|uniref:response regulator transcription factor n=1 Tax=Paenibacillus cymbidii TaxID=1639034 RepID=UPI001081054A|nr:response regulator [Paenibacillus cymbidii]